MRPGISTHVFLQQRLSTGLLDALHRGGATAIEIFAARHHFDYTDRSATREIAAWFRDTSTLPTLHQPLYSDAQWSRHVAPTLNLIDPDKSRRIDAMDEVKRALEAAEQIPFRAIVLHLGMKGEEAGPRSLENSLTAIEHLRTFAAPLGVQILLENLQNDVTTPEHLLEILRIGRFDSVGVCLDVGHAHLTDYANPGAGIEAAFHLLQTRIVQLHLHENNGRADQHLWPGAAPAAGSIADGPLENRVDWNNVQRLLSRLSPDTTGILEIAHDLGETTDSVAQHAREVFDAFRRSADVHAEQARHAEA